MQVPKRVSIDMDDEEEEGGDNSNASKKPRVIWSVELHQEFVNAVNQLGIDSAYRTCFPRIRLKCLICINL